MHWNKRPQLTHNSKYQQPAHSALHQAAVLEVGTTTLSLCWCMAAPCHRTGTTVQDQGRPASVRHYNHHTHQFSLFTLHYSSSSYILLDRSTSMSYKSTQMGPCQISCAWMQRTAEHRPHTQLVLWRSIVITPRGWYDAFHHGNYSTYRNERTVVVSAAELYVNNSSTIAYKWHLRSALL